MIATIIELSVKNKFLVILATLFVIAAGIYAIARTPLDAIPDLSDVQVIIFTEYPGQAPQVVEDQVTYPLTTAMLAVPFAKVVRGYSFFGFSFVYIIFEDGTDLYWARSRVLEYLNFVAGRLPQGVTPSLGPDATGVGWVYEYVLEERPASTTWPSCASIQDWYLRYELTSGARRLRGGQHRRLRQAVSGGGGSQQAAGLRHPHPEGAHGHPAQQQRRGRPAGRDGRDRVHGAGPGLYQESLEDLEPIAVGCERPGHPDPAAQRGQRCRLGPELRRGIAEWNGEGEVVGGVVVMRYGENALQVIDNVKQKLGSARSRAFPKG